MNQLLTFFFCCLSTLIYAQESKNNLSIAELDSLSNQYYLQNNVNEADKYGSLYFEKIKALGKKDTLYAKGMIRLGKIKADLQQHETAEQLFIQSIPILEKHLGSQHYEIAKVHSNLALLYKDMGFAQKAFSRMAQAEKIYGDQHTKKDYYLTFLNDYGLIHKEVGNYEDAEAYYLLCLELNEDLKGDQHPNHATYLANLAAVYLDMNRQQEAEPLFLEASKIYLNTQGENSLQYASSLNNLAVLYETIDRFEESIQNYKKTLNILESIVGPNHYYYAISLQNLAAVYESKNDYKNAVHFHEKSLKTFQQTVGDQHPAYLSNKDNIGLVQLKLKNYEAANKCFREVLEVRETSLPKFHGDLIISNFHLGKTAMLKGDYNSAEQYLKESIRLNAKSEKTLNLNQLDLLHEESFSNPVSLVRSIEAIAELFEKKYELNQKISDLQLAKSLLNFAINQENKNRKSFNNNTDKLANLKQINKLVSKSLEQIDKLAKVDPSKQNEYWAESFKQIEQNKSMLLADALKGAQARQFGDLPDNLAKKEQQLQDQLADLAQEIVQSNSESSKQLAQKKQNKLNIEINQFKQLLKGDYPNYHQLKYQEQNCKLEDLQKILAEDELLIEYFLSDDAVFVFYSTSKTHALKKLDITATELKKYSTSYRTKLSNYQAINNLKKQDIQAFIKEAHWFYTKLLAPILKTNSKSKHLIIVPDAILGHLPFETFLSEANQEADYQKLAYLIKQYRISYSYSVKLLQLAITAPKRNNNVQILGIAANYAHAEEKASTRSPKLRNLRRVLIPLPEARKEIERLEQNFDGTFWFDESATESNFKKNASKFAVLHLAMHGLLNKEKPILSSLAFTENEDIAEDNFLEAWEISKLNLNADLVVLSACETGYGKFEQGEGVLSLARSFLYAGVPSLLVSLWEVNDASTAILIQYFYEGLAKGMNKAMALQQAKLRYLEESNALAAHPAFWSAFIQIGNHKAIQIKQKSFKGWGWIAWSLGGSLLFLLISAFLFRRKRTS